MKLTETPGMSVTMAWSLYCDELEDKFGRNLLKDAPSFTDFAAGWDAAKKAVEHALKGMTVR